ncbi:MAG: DEAD/DEAH box helicase, partial [Rhodocyclaceae bacterium]|nr:DEAD/DEAH box helicase [Rhodocyclaceae bacterium]
MSDELVEIECPQLDAGCQSASSAAAPDPGSEDGPRTIALADFLRIYGADLLRSVGQQNPPVFDGRADPERERQMHGLRRKPLPAQADAVQAVMRLLVDAGAPAAIINGEMGTGKTMMGIMAGALLHAAGYPRTLIIAPPHLVYKWRREILETVPRARVWVLNGPDTLRKLLKLRDMQATPDVPEYFVLGRVRMRLGFNWKPVFVTRKFLRRDELGRQVVDYAACPRCGSVIYGDDGEPLAPQVAASVLAQNRRSCNARPDPDKPACGEALWSLVGPGRAGKPARQMVLDALQQIPTIGAKTAERLLQRFGEEVLSGMLADNVYQFVNLMDGDGELVFSDRQARRMERALATAEFAFGQGGYQA